MHTAANHAMASTGQYRRRSDRRGGVKKFLVPRPRPPRSLDMLESLSAHAQPAPPDYGSLAPGNTYGSQLNEASVATQELGPFLPGSYNLSQLDQSFESRQMFGGTGDNRANEWNTVTSASANVPFDDIPGSFGRAPSATPPPSFCTGPGSSETPVQSGSGHVMVKLWRNLQAEHSWFFQVEMDEFEIKFHHTPSTGQPLEMTTFKEKWEQLRDYNLQTLGDVVGNGHAFIRQIAVFNRLLEQPEIGSLLGPNAFRTIGREVMFLNKKLEQARCMPNNERLSAWTEKNEQATRDVVATLHDWVLSLRVALQLVPSQDALTDRKMVSYKRLTPGVISRIFENLRQPEATVVYLQVE